MTLSGSTSPDVEGPSTSTSSPDTESPNNEGTSFVFYNLIGDWIDKRRFLLIVISSLSALPLCQFARVFHNIDKVFSIFSSDFFGFTPLSYHSLSPHIPFHQTSQPLVHCVSYLSLTSNAITCCASNYLRLYFSISLVVSILILLRLSSIPMQTIISSSFLGESEKTYTGAIAGGTFAGVFVLLCIVAGAAVFLHLKSTKKGSGDFTLNSINI